MLLFNECLLYYMTQFWDPIVEKDDNQMALEERVFGCDDLWGHIKSFIFSPKTCWAISGGCTDPCKGDVFISYIQKHKFKHFRQGEYKNGIYTTRMYTCRKHVYKDGENPCLIS